MTGVGLFVDVDEGSFVAPPEADTGWNSIGYRQEQSQELGVRDRFENSLYGFVFHESCWSVLERVFYPDPVPLDRLYELCLSIPKRFIDCATWGHDYGGLYYWGEKPYYPWDVFEDPWVYEKDDLEDTESGDSEAEREWVERYGPAPTREDDSDDSELNEPTLRISTVTSDPFVLNEALVILQEQPQSPPVRPESFSLSRGTVDRFSRLPQELRFEIARHLPTTDFLTGRLALRGLWDIFDSQQFWSTRFLRHGAERSWFFEAQHLPGCRRDWRFLYKQTSDAQASHSGGMRNRRRVWEMALRLHGVFSLKPLIKTTSFEDKTNDGNVEWIAAQADICNPPPERPHWLFMRGCRVLHRQQVRPISPGQNIRIALSFIQVGEQSYLSGLRLDYGDGDGAQVGYRAPTEQIVELGSDIWSGIRLAIGPRGVQGLQFVSDGGSNCSAWYGRSEDLPQTDCLVSQGPIVALEFGLDVCLIRRNDLYLANRSPIGVQSCQHCSCSTSITPRDHDRKSSQPPGIR